MGMIKKHPTYRNAEPSTSILTITRDEMWLSVVLSILVMIAFVVYYNKIFAVTFDENFAKATGVKAERYNLLIAVAIAVVIVLGMDMIYMSKPSCTAFGWKCDSCFPSMASIVPMIAFLRFLFPFC